MELVCRNLTFELEQRRVAFKTLRNALLNKSFNDGGYLLMNGAYSESKTSLFRAASEEHSTLLIHKSSSECKLTGSYCGTGHNIYAASGDPSLSDINNRTLSNSSFIKNTALLLCNTHSYESIPQQDAEIRLTIVPEEFRAWYSLVLLFVGNN